MPEWSEVPEVNHQQVLEAPMEMVCSWIEANFINY